ncbi:MAG: sensor histidine kinase [Phenylobacterium sp.]|uniref:ATP-binding protein n=1 Tax=Phenylobacterium sp. TaxID=1871053 RepID=UPI001222712F|nr:sensor histidine kinase [Phenylobacterium sp.]TAJ72793.1 MAG: sensor histidine kinase [Phenylobacterium sp.]
MTPEFHIAETTGRDFPLHLVEEISHRVANEYAEAIAGLSLAAAGSPRCEVKQALRAAAERLHAHAESHRALLPPIQGQVNLADHVGRLCSAFSKATLADRQVRLAVETDDIWLASDRAWRIGLAVAELVRNAARHGLRGRAGAIVVQVALAGDEVVCSVGDDGVAASAVQPGRGVSLVQALAMELGGSVEWWFSQRGSVARLRAPIDARS